MDSLLTARSLMGLTLAFHIFYAAVGVSLPLTLTVAKWRYRSIKAPPIFCLPSVE
jgi:cytochrome bd ubiquinol oxidase subunit I